MQTICFQNANLVSLDLTLTMQHLYKDYFCGWGLSEDTESTIDGVNGNGFVDQSNGPFVVRFHDDGVKPDEIGGEITDDIGFVIDYDLQTAD